MSWPFLQYTLTLETITLDKLLILPASNQALPLAEAFLHFLRNHGGEGDGCSLFCVPLAAESSTLC